MTQSWTGHYGPPRQTHARQPHIKHVLRAPSKGAWSLTQSWPGAICSCCRLEVSLPCGSAGAWYHPLMEKRGLSPVRTWVRRGLGGGAGRGVCARPCRVRLWCLRGGLLARAGLCVRKRGPPRLARAPPEATPGPRAAAHLLHRVEAAPRLDHKHGHAVPKRQVARRRRHRRRVRLACAGGAGVIEGRLRELGARRARGRGAMQAPPPERAAAAWGRRGRERSGAIWGARSGAIWGARSGACDLARPGAAHRPRRGTAPARRRPRRPRACRGRSGI